MDRQSRRLALEVGTSTTFAKIDRKNGEIRLMRFREIVETVENEATQLTLAQGQRISPEIKQGEFSSTTAADRFRPYRRADRQQVIVQKVREPSAAPVREYKIARGDRQRPGQTGRVRQRHGRSWPRRAMLRATSCCRADVPQWRRVRAHL